jgi:hypothetical protein
MTQPQQQQHQTLPSCASGHASHTKTNNGAPTTIVQVRVQAPSNINTLHQLVRCPRHPHHSRHHWPIRSGRGASSRGYAALGLGIGADAPDRAQTGASIPPSAPIRSASDPPLYPSYYSMLPTRHRWWREYYHETLGERLGSSTANAAGGSGGGVA